MVGGLQGEEWKFIKKYLKKRSKSVGCKYREALRTISQVKTRSARFRRRSKRAAKWFRSAAKLAFSLRCSASNVSQISGNFRRNSTALCKIAAKWFRSKRVISQLCKILHSTWSDWLPMAVTPSFQLRIVHRLKHWIVNFLSFEMKYSMHKLDSRKCSKSG